MERLANHHPSSLIADSCSRIFDHSRQPCFELTSSKSLERMLLKAAIAVAIVRVCLRTIGDDSRLFYEYHKLSGYTTGYDRILSAAYRHHYLYSFILLYLAFDFRHSSALTVQQLKSSPTILSASRQSCNDNAYFTGAKISSMQVIDVSFSWHQLHQRQNLHWNPCQMLLSSGL